MKNMEVDVLGPKSTQLNDVILWFEFLLKPNLLSAHLKKQNPDPAPIDLIQQFLSVAPDAQQQPQNPELNSPDVEAMNKNEGLKMGRKQLALKILALKVAAHLKFNLDIFETHLPLIRQVQLLSDLCTVTSGKPQNLPISVVNDNLVIGPEGSKHALNFALTLYHRFVLRAQVKRGCQTKNNKILMLIPGTDPNLLPTRDDFFISSMEGLTQNSIDFLMQVMQDPEPFRLLTFDCFIALDASSDSVSQCFDQAVTITKTEVKVQIYFDLCMYHLFTKNYKLARESVIACRDTLRQLKQEYAAKGRKDFLYCTLDEEELNAYLMACGVFDEQVPRIEMTLMHRVNESIQRQYGGIVQIFKEDNLKREIPMTQRKVIEQDIEGSISTGNLKDAKEMHHQVIALNVIRYIVDDTDIQSCDIFVQRYKKSNDVLGIFFALAGEAYNLFSLTDKVKVKNYVTQLIALLDPQQIVQVVKPSSLFTQKEIDDLCRQRSDEIPTLTGIGLQTEWCITDTKTIPRLEQAAAERQLCSCTSATLVRKLLVKLAGMNPTKPMWSINPSWAVPDQLRVVIMSINRGFLQDFTYILIGKAKELIAKGDYASAIALLVVAKNETQRQEFQNMGNVPKLCKLIQWEIILVQIQQALQDWPKSPTDPQQIIRNCKLCIAALTGNETIIPRIEVLEYCSAMLLNLGEWSSVILPEKRFSGLELFSAFANAVVDIDKSKGTKGKINKDAWDLLLPIFQNAPSQKRPGMRDSRDSPSLPQTMNFQAFLKKLRDKLIVSIVLSLLCRLHNILKDEPNSDINAEYMILWPNSVSNANGYSSKAVGETINMLLKQGFQYYPNHIPWLKIKGDLEFASNNFEAAMKYYVTVLITGTEYCTMMLQKPVWYNEIVRRMIKCSSNLGCYMQAAILCQCLDETDYSLAFKSISEKTSSFSDAMDAYYGCIWDPTLLEFIINMHSKKGEHKRKLQAVSNIFNF